MVVVAGGVGKDPIVDRQSVAAVSYHCHGCERTAAVGKRQWVDGGPVMLKARDDAVNMEKEEDAKSLDRVHVHR